MTKQLFGGAPKERRRLSCVRNGCPKGSFWRRPIPALTPRGFALKTPENLIGSQRRNDSRKKTLLDNRFSARRLLRSFGALWLFWKVFFVIVLAAMEDFTRISWYSLDVSFCLLGIYWSFARIWTAIWWRYHILLVLFGRVPFRLSQSFILPTKKTCLEDRNLLN